MSQKRVVREVLNAPHFGEDIEVLGWVRTKRESKAGLTFLEVNDGSYFQNLQIVVPAGMEGYATEMPKLHVGASVRIAGKEVPSQGGKQAVEVQASEVNLIGACDPQAYAIGKQKMSYEYLRDFTHLRPRTNTFSAIARVRNTLAMAIHEFFQGQGLRPSSRETMRKARGRCSALRLWTWKSRPAVRMGKSTSPGISSGRDRT
jgi:asparaginyl-tRNA synthetase